MVGWHWRNSNEPTGFCAFQPPGDGTWGHIIGPPLELHLGGDGCMAGNQVQGPCEADGSSYFDANISPPYSFLFFDQRNIRDWQAHPMKRLPVKQHI